MKKLSISIRNLLIVVLIALPIQTIGIGSASAAPGSADLSTYLSAEFSGGSFVSGVCNNGDETVVEFEFDLAISNYTINSYIVTLNSSLDLATDRGSIDDETATWTGILEDGQCVEFATIGDPYGDVGEMMNASIAIANSKLLGDVENVDPVSNNDVTTLSPTEIVALPDIEMTTRLITGGNIDVGDPVSYEIAITNVGQGASLIDSGEGNNFAFIIPDYASFSSAIDLDTDDSIDLVGCSDFGPPINAGSGFGAYSGTIVVCFIDGNAPLLSGQSAKFEFQLVASAGFLSGDVTVRGSVTGDDRDTMLVILDIALGGDPFVDLPNINNIVTLEYDADALIATSSLCPGQSLTSTDGTACFRISFNKDIYEPSFTIASLELSGSGTIQSLIKIGDNLWEVRVAGITKGGSTTLQLVDSNDPNSVKDYSAVIGDVFVLGESTIRYDADAAASESAAGTLAETGKDANDWLTSFYLLAIGFALVASSRKKQIKSRRRISL